MNRTELKSLPTLKMSWRDELKVRTPTMQVWLRGDDSGYHTEVLRESGGWAVAEVFDFNENSVGVLRQSVPGWSEVTA